MYCKYISSSTQLHLAMIFWFVLDHFIDTQFQLVLQLFLFCFLLSYFSYSLYMERQ